MKSNSGAVVGNEQEVCPYGRFRAEIDVSTPRADAVALLINRGNVVCVRVGNAGRIAWLLFALQTWGHRDQVRLGVSIGVGISISNI